MLSILNLISNRFLQNVEYLIFIWFFYVSLYVYEDLGLFVCSGIFSMVFRLTWGRKATLKLDNGMDNR